MAFRFAAICLVLLCAIIGGAVPASAQEWSQPARLDIYPAEISGTADTKPQVATDNAGNWVAVWASYEGLISAHSSDLGSAWKTGALISEPADAHRYGPLTRGDVVFAGGNTYVAVWVSHVEPTARGYLAVSTDHGQTWSAPQLLQDSLSHPSTTVSGLQSDGEGTVMVVVNTALFRSTDAGNTWNETHPIDALNPSEISYAGDDCWLLVSKQKTGVGISAFTYISHDNGLTWSDPVKHGLGTKGNVLGTAAMGENLALLATYEDHYYARDTLMLSSTDGGDTWTTTPLNWIEYISDPNVSFNVLPNGKWMFCYSYWPYGNFETRDIAVYLADNLMSSWSRQPNVTTMAGATDIDPAFAADHAGNLLLVFSSKPAGSDSSNFQNDIYSTARPALSSGWSSPTRVSFDEGFNAPFNDTDVSIAAGDDGIMIAVWESTQPFGLPRQAVMARSSDSGKTWSQVVSLGSYIEPRIIYAGQGRWLAWWQQQKLGAHPQYRISNDNGLTWSATETFYGYTAAGSSHGTMIKAMVLYPGWQQQPQFELSRMAPGSNLWSDYQVFPDRLRAIVHSGGPNWFATTYDGTAVYTSFDDGFTWTRMPVENLPKGIVEFASDHAGNVLAVYTVPVYDNESELVASKTTDNGLTWSAPTPIATVQDLGEDRTPIPHMTIGYAVQHVPAVAAAAMGAGRWAVSWQLEVSSESPTIHTTFSIDDGKTWSAPELLATYGHDYFATESPAMAADGENVVVAWPYYAGDTEPNDYWSGPFVDLLYRYKTVPKVVEPDPAADLVGAWGLVESQCKTTKKGQKCKLKAQIFMANVGEVQAAEKSAVRFYLSDNQILDPADIELKSKKLPKLKPGKSKNQKVKLKADQAFTGKYLITVLDADGQVDELSEANNTVVSPILE